MQSRKADRLSREIFYVAAARSLGMPARIDPVTAATQYLSPEGAWRNVSLESADEKTGNNNDYVKGELTLKFSPEGYMVDPKYYSQFSISRISNGVPRQLEFDEGATVSQIFSKPLALEPGRKPECRKYLS